jgi:type IV pilus assembly protein PilC
VFAFRRYLKTEYGRRQFDNFKLKMPVLGGLFLSVAIEHFTASLGMLLRGGISIVHALDIAITATANKVLEEALEKVRLSVIEGKTLTAPLVEIGIFPPLVTQMVSVGEESGKLVQLLDEVSKYYKEDISTKITRLTALLEPAVLIVMGVIIAVLVIAMYLPVFTMVSTVGA